MRRLKSANSEAKTAFQRVFPIFEWVECSHCHCEFRRERLWRTVTGPYYGRQGRLTHYCSHCAPTQDDAMELLRARQEKIRNARPLTPPPPPKRILDH